MKLNVGGKLLEKYISKVGTYYFYERFIIGEINEGINFTSKMFEKTLTIALQHYGTKKPFGYISNRIHSYSVFPLDYLNCDEQFMDNFKAYAIVTYTETSQLSTNIEKRFAQKPFEQFNKLDHAILWMEELIAS